MYQNEMKESFIQDYIRSRVVATTSLYSLFRKTEPYEEKFKKDCSQFTKEEILDMYSDFKAKSVHVLLNYNVILKAYCAYKKYYHNMETEIAYNEITTDMLKPCVSKDKNKILSREEVTEIEDQLYNWTDRAIVEALFEGLSGNSMRDLIGLNANMINHEDKELIFPDGRIFNLTDRLYNFLLKAFEETEYLCYGDTLRVKKLIGVGRLYKERDNAHAMDTDDKFFRWVYRKVQNFRNHVGIPGLTMKNIESSGLLYYLKEGMKETQLGLKEFLLTEMGNKVMNKYGFTSEFRVDNIYYRYSELV